MQLPPRECAHVELVGEKGDGVRGQRDDEDHTRAAPEGPQSLCAPRLARAVEHSAVPPPFGVRLQPALQHVQRHHADPAHRAGHRARHEGGRVDAQAEACSLPTLPTLPTLSALCFVCFVCSVCAHTVSVCASALSVAEGAVRGRSRCRCRGPSGSAQEGVGLYESLVDPEVEAGTGHVADRLCAEAPVEPAQAVEPPDVARAGEGRAVVNGEQGRAVHLRLHTRTVLSLEIGLNS